MDKNVNLFQEYGAPCHMSKAINAWKKSQGVNSLPWVTQSLDLNPIEHVLEHLGRKLRERATKIMLVATLKETLLKYRSDDN